MAQSIFLQKTPDVIPDMTPATQVVQQTTQGIGIGSIVLWIIGLIIAFYFIRWIVRLIFELVMSQNLVYVQIALPRSDSKLDKEHETKKDFKEKVGVMNLVHNAIWKISSTSLKYTVLNFIFDYIKISYEIIYKENQVYFYIVTYKSLFHTISQSITSIYPDAEVIMRDKSEYITFTGNHSVIRSTSIRKIDDPYFPIKTYKYFEEDPLSTFTNVF